MSESQKKDLTSQDALDKMSAYIGLEAQKLRFGTLYFPNEANPAIECEVNNGLITQIKLLVKNNGPDQKKRFRSDN